MDLQIRIQIHMITHVFMQKTDTLHNIYDQKILLTPHRGKKKILVFQVKPFYTQKF